MALTLIDSVPIDQVGGGTRTLSLYQGDITDMTAAQAVDFICVSALPGDYSPTGGSVISALAAKGVSVQSQSQNKAANYEPTMPCWVSQNVASAGLNFNQFILFEPSNPSITAGWDIGMIFQALSCYKGTAATSIALPMVCTGSGGADFTMILRELFFKGANFGSRTAWPVSEVRLVVYSAAHAATATTQFATMKAQYLNPPLAGGNTGTPPSGMTQRQYNCVKAYTGSAYYSVNTALRANSLTDANFISYRATIELISAGLANLPNYSGLTARGANLPQSVINQYTVGALITHYSFTSTSWDRPWGGSCLLKINSATGKNVQAISYYPQEDEVLYDWRMTDTVTVVQGAGTEYGHSYSYRFTSNQTVPNWCG